MPGYNSSGTEALQALAKETKDKKIKDILVLRFQEEKINLINLQIKCKAIDTLFNKINFITVSLMDIS